MKDWTTNGIYTIKDTLHNDNQMIPFSDLERNVGSSPRRLFEYNAIKKIKKNNT